MKIICFTYAGGKAEFFNTIDDATPDLDFVKLDYSGHGVRRKEPYYCSFSELTKDMYGLLKNNLSNDDRYALFGYSMGAITATDILHKIEKEGEIPPPLHVFLAAHEPHSKAELIDYSEDELDEYVKERTIRFGGVPKRLINNEIFWRIYLPLYRADYSIISTFFFEDLNFITHIPLTVFYSEKDTPLTEMEKWKKYYQGDSKFYEFEGSHFFINVYYREMAEIMKERLGL